MTATMLLLKVTVLLLLAMWTARYMSGLSAAVRSLVLASAFGALLVMPMGALLLPPLTLELPMTPAAAPPSSRGLITNVDESQSSPSNPNTIGESTEGPAKPWRTVLFGGWMVGIVVTLLPVLGTLRAVTRLRRGSQPWTECAVITETLAACRGPRRVDVRVADLVSAPLTFGVTAPVVVLPVDAVNWPRVDLVRALLHELEHIRRRDFLVRGAARVICSVYWFHPLVWMAWRRLCLESEHACDDAVVRGGDRIGYAEQLIRLARRVAATDAPGGGLSMVDRSDLRKRIAAVLVDDRSRARAGSARATLVNAAAAVVVLMLSPVTAVPAPQAGASLPASASSLPAFDVASIKRNRSRNAQTMYGFQRGGRFLARNVTVRQLIIGAYGIEIQAPGRLIGGPGWIDEDRFDIEAKADGAAFDAEQNRLRVRALLRDRFRLLLRTETRQLPVYALVRATRDGRLGPQLRSSGATCPDPKAGPPPPPPPGTRPSVCGVRLGPGTLVGEAARLSQLALMLSSLPSVGRMVRDDSGLTGLFDFTLDWELGTQAEPDQPDPIRAAGPSIFTALQEQLGLRLESRSAAVEVLVIDSVEPPIEN